MIQMRRALKVIVPLGVLLVVSVGLISIFRLSRHPVGQDDRISPVDVAGRVTLRFDGCAANRAVFLFENGLDRPIYARVHSVEWKEFQEARLQYGLHKVFYKAPTATDFQYVGPMSDAVDSFRPVLPHEIVRYGVDLWKGPGDYKVTVPYMEDAEVARGLNENWVAMVKEQLERVNGAWREVSSAVVTNNCQ